MSHKKSFSKGLRAQKEAYLKKRYDLDEVYGKYETITHCEICEEDLATSYRISKALSFYEIKISGEFHHDGKRELHLYCRTCHKRIHDWGVIQRWLLKIGKTIDDIPDASNTKAIRKGRGWGHD